MCGLLLVSVLAVLGGLGQFVHVELADGVLSDGVDDNESALSDWLPILALSPASCSQTSQK